MISVEWLKRELSNFACRYRLYQILAYGDKPPHPFYKFCFNHIFVIGKARQTLQILCADLYREVRVDT